VEHYTRFDNAFEARLINDYSILSAPVQKSP